MAFTIEWTYSDPEVALRVRPLREQWEARGPGLIAALAKRLPWLALDRRVRVCLEKPVRGGWGSVVSADEIRFEAVLANASPTLPEVMRLGWLCAQAASLQGEVNGSVSSSQRTTHAALIPVVLSVGEYVELCRFDEATVSVALTNWLADDMDNQPRPGSLLAWWNSNAGQVSSAADWADALSKLSPN